MRSVLEWIAYVIAAGAVSVCIGWLQLAGRRRRTSRGTIVVPAAIRRSSPRPATGRWKHGYVTIEGPDLFFEPRLPRFRSRPIGIPAFAAGRPRRLRWTENFWIAPGSNIYPVSSRRTGHAYELALPAQATMILLDHRGRHAFPAHPA